MTKVIKPQWPESRFISRLGKAEDAGEASAIFNEIRQSRLSRSFVELMRTAKSVGVLHGLPAADWYQQTLDHIEHQRELATRRRKKLVTEICTAANVNWRRYPAVERICKSP